MIRSYVDPTPNPAKVALFPQEAARPCEAVPVDTSKGEQHLSASRTVNPNGTVPAIVDTPMLPTGQAGPELAFNRDPASAVAAAIVGGIVREAFEVARGGEAGKQTIALDRDDLIALKDRFFDFSRCWTRQSETTMRFEARS